MTPPSEHPDAQPPARSAGECVLVRSAGGGLRNGDLGLPAESDASLGALGVLVADENSGGRVCFFGLLKHQLA